MWWPRWIQTVAEIVCGRPRVIYDREGKRPYLSRYYVMKLPTMPDGSWPFDDRGGPKDGIRWPKGPFQLYIHRFHTSDAAGDLHTHPWKWAVSLILSGGYREERYVWHIPAMESEDNIVARVFRPGSFNVLKSDDAHRVDLLSSQECWSLIVVGPKFKAWGFRDRETGRFIPWREYIRGNGKMENSSA